ncbi:MAG: hypothetical protein ACFFCF_02750 [Promethearchaeota archaeon]
MFPIIIVIVTSLLSTVLLTLGLVAFFAIATALSTGQILSDRDIRGEGFSFRYFLWLYHRRPRTWATVIYISSLAISFLVNIQIFLALYYGSPLIQYLWVSLPTALLMLVPVGFWFILRYPK